MSKPISAYQTTTKTEATPPNDLTATPLAGDKWALDVNVLAGSVTITPDTAATPTVYNLTPGAGVEVSQALPANTKRFLIKLRDTGSGSVTRVGYVINSTNAGPYLTFPSNATYDEQKLDASGLTIYLQTSLAGQVIEIVSWV